MPYHYCFTAEIHKFGPNASSQAQSYMKFRKLIAALRSVPMSLFFTQVIVAGVALIVNVFSARTLGPEARGELALFMQIAYVANAVSILGRHRAYLRLESPETPSLATSYMDIRRLSTMPLVLSILISIIVVAIIGDGLIAGLVLATGFFALIYSGVQQKTFRAAAIVAGDASPYFFGTVSGQLVLLVAAVFLAVFDVTSISLWLMVYGLSVIAPYIVVSLRLTTGSKSSQSPAARLQRVKRLGVKLVPLSVAEIVGARVDRFLIPALANFAQLGIYTVVVTMTELIAWPIRNYTDAKVPNWTREIADNRLRMVREILVVSTGITLLSLIVGSVLSVVLTPLFGEEFSSGIELIWPLVLAAALHAWTHFGTNLCLAAGFTGLVNAIPVVGMIVSSASYFMLIPPMGAMGAAWGLVIGYSFSIMVSVPGLVGIAKRK